MSNYGWGGVPVDAFYGGDSPAPSNVPPGVQLIPSDPDMVRGEGEEQASVAADLTRCQQANAEGKQCKAWPKKGEKYCGIHLRQMKAQDFLDEAVNELDA